MLYAFQHKVSKQLVCYQNKEFYFDDLLCSNVIHFKELSEAINWLKINSSNSLFKHIRIDDLELVSVSTSILASNLSMFLKDKK